MPQDDLEWALAAHRDKKRQRRYKLHRGYYDGEHRLAFADERFLTVFGEKFFAVRDNLCPAVVDSVSDRLKVIGFRSSATRRRKESTDAGERTIVSDPLGAQAWAIWKRNRMAQRAAEVHRESLLTGDGYAIVWPTEAGTAAIWPQRAEEIVVHYSETIPGQIDRAARIWKADDSRLRATLYYPDAIERYVSGHRGDTPSAGRFAPVEGDDPRSEHDFGRVPVFHFPNRRLFDYGVSELRDVVPLQDALNKAVCDMLVAMEFSAFRQRWAVGVGDDVSDGDDEDDDEDEGTTKEPPFRPGIDRIFALADHQAKFGEFSETNLEQFLKVQEDLRAEIARVSGTPLHYLFITRGDFPSGEAMKSAEARFTEKLEDQQESKGNTWEDALQFALTVEGARIPSSFELSTTWQDAAPRSDEERARTGSIKKTLGVTRRQLLVEQGYDDELIEQMLAEEPVGGGEDEAAANEQLGLLAQRFGLAVQNEVMTAEEARRELRKRGLELDELSA